MMKFVEIAVNVPRVSGVFHYHLPLELESEIEIGNLVVVPFGKQLAHGVVLGFVDQPEVPETRAVSAILDQKVRLLPRQLKLARWMAKSTHAPLATCVSLMLPPGLSQQSDTEYSLRGEDSPTELKANEKSLVELLEKRGVLRGRQIDSALPRRNWRNAMRVLIKKEIVESRPVLPPPRVRPKYVRTAQLSVPPEIVIAGLEGLGSRDHTQSRRQKILDFLAREAGPVDVSWVYAESGGNMADLRKLNDLGLLMLREEQAWRDPLAGLAYDPTLPPILTGDQASVWEKIESKIKTGQKTKPFLLHGVTGSGKTEIYLRAVAEIIKQGKQAIFLVPEIALTPQTLRRIMARFPGRVGLVHSRLSEGERYDTWRRAREGKLSVIVGPRSALFSPLPNLGLIVVDESHDGSYYQNMILPYYHARDVAERIADQENILCIFGSATPALGSYFQAQQGRWELLSLPARILAHKETVRQYRSQVGGSPKFIKGEAETEYAELPPVQIVDMREELKQGNRSIFSEPLQEALADVLNKQQQAILFLNRRGTATYVFCRDCGHSLTCPRCETNLTFHRRGNDLLCHHCGYQRKMPKQCPECESDRIRQYGTGTEKVEAEVKEIFPEARTLRWDHETTRKKGAHEIILSHFTNHRADILIGTQMLAKGLDLPLVTLVGVVLADVGLNMPDFRAGERVFQVLTQVAGRAGRSPLGGQVILQSFSPEHYVIQAAAKHDYQGFIEQEFDYRKKLHYPPYSKMIRLVYRHRNADRAQEEAQRLAGFLEQVIYKKDRRATELIGPAPGFYSRLDGIYRWQIILRGPNPASLLDGLKLADWRVEINPQILL